MLNMPMARSPARAAVATLALCLTMYPALCLTLCLAVALAGCASVRNVRGGDSKTPAAKPGMNASGEVIDARKVEPGTGQKAVGPNGQPGEITGRPAPNSAFSQLQIGMPAQQVLALLGAPSDQGERPHQGWMPAFVQADRYRYQLVYQGMGRLVFASDAGLGLDANPRLVWIIHSAAESGVR